MNFRLQLLKKKEISIKIDCLIVTLLSKEKNVCAFEKSHIKIRYLQEFFSFFFPL